MSEDVAPGQEAYDRITRALEENHDQVAAGKMFGMPCLKVGGKAFAGLSEGRMAFKLTGNEHRRALAIPGARLFDPSGRNRPMREWVDVPAMEQMQWPDLAEAAMQYVQATSQRKS